MKKTKLFAAGFVIAASFSLTSFAGMQNCVGYGLQNAIAIDRSFVNSEGKRTVSGSYQNKQSGFTTVSYMDDFAVKYPMYVGLCNESISLRVAPDTGAQKICDIPLYAMVGYICTAPNGFYKVNFGGNIGYVLGYYLDTEEPQIAIGMYMRVVNCRQSITLRVSPSIKAGEICQIPLGAVVFVECDAANGFYKVNYNGFSGYVLSQYIAS